MDGIDVQGNLPYPRWQATHLCIQKSCDSGGWKSSSSQLLYENCLQSQPGLLGAKICMAHAWRACSMTAAGRHLTTFQKSSFQSAFKKITNPPLTTSCDAVFFSQVLNNFFLVRNIRNIGNIWKYSEILNGKKAHFALHKCLWMLKFHSWCPLDVCYSFVLHS